MLCVCVCVDGVVGCRYIKCTHAHAVTSTRKGWMYNTHGLYEEVTSDGVGTDGI